MTVQLRLEQVNLYAKLKSQLQGYPILQDISFDVACGDRLAIIGPAGAGKTSLLRLINRLGEPNSGKIYLENQEYQQISAIQLRQMVTLVLQEPRLLGMTVQQALAYPLVLRCLPKEIIQQRVSHWVEQMQIPNDWLGRTEVQLSSGQRQIVAIARALVIQPKILLLDEPTSNLDIGRASHIIQVLTKLTPTLHTTVVMINSQLDLAKMFCNRLLYLQQGRLLANQTAPEINWMDLEQRMMHAENQANEEWN